MNTSLNKDFLQHRCKANDARPAIQTVKTRVSFISNLGTLNDEQVMKGKQA